MWDTRLSQIQIGDDFHTGGDSRLHRLRNQYILNQNAIDARAHPHHSLFGLKMDVTGATINGAGDDLLDQADDRGVFGFVRHPTEDRFQGRRLMPLLLILFLEDLVN